MVSKSYEKFEPSCLEKWFPCATDQLMCLDTVLIMYMGSLKTELRNIQKRIEIIKDLFDTNYRKEIRPVICII